MIIYAIYNHYLIWVSFSILRSTSEDGLIMLLWIIFAGAAVAFSTFETSTFATGKGGSSLSGLSGADLGTGHIL